MKPWIWLRIAAALQALGTVGHNLATLSTKATHGPLEQAVFDAMRGFQFNIMGSTRSTWDFYRGYRLHIVHDDFDGQTATCSGSVDGWPLMLSSLKSLLETGKPLATK
jgi:hypothetical protein